MGAGIARRLMRDGHHCVVFDASEKTVASLAADGAHGVSSIEDMVPALGQSPRAIWVMLPSGRITEETVAKLGHLLDKSDIVIDGGNSYYKDDIRRAKTLRERGIRYATA
jgi:6-phosphogluconate dehydrogenase